MAANTRKELHLEETVGPNDLDKILDRAVGILVATGFEVEKRSPRELALRGSVLNSTHQNPLLGIGSGMMSVDRAGRLTLDADLRGARGLGRFVLLFPFALGTFLALFFAVLFTALGNPNGALVGLIAAASAVVPWVIVGPWMAKWILRRTRRAAEAFLRSLVHTA